MTAGEWAYFIVMAPFALYGLLVICVFVGRVVCDILDAWTWHRDSLRRTRRSPRPASDREERTSRDEAIPDDAWA